MVTKATKEMLPRMNELWTKYFGDSVEYSSFFFKQHLKGETVYENQFVYLEDGQVASMLTVLQGELSRRTKKDRFWYIYAVVTDEKYRRRGYAGKVLKHVLDLAKKQNVFVGLVPANDALYNYYSKFGFETFFYKKVEELTLFPEETKSCNLQIADPSLYKKLRDEAYCNDNYIVWDEHAVKYALQENENSGGKAYTCGDTGCFILVCPVGETLMVRETNLPQQELQIVCSVLGKQFHCAKASITASASSEIRGISVKHGMIFYTDKLSGPEDDSGNFMKEETGYIGLALD